MAETNKIINKYKVRIGPDEFEFFAEDEWEDANEFAKEHNTTVSLI